MQVARIFLRGLSSEGPIRPIWDKILKSTINKKLKQPERWQLNKRIPTRRVNCDVNSNQLWKNNSGSCETSKSGGPQIRQFSHFRRLINQNLSKIGYRSLLNLNRKPPMTFPMVLSDLTLKCFFKVIRRISWNHGPIFTHF